MSSGPFTKAEGYEQALALDEADPLASYRDRFVITDPELIYLDGNSLGRLPKAASSIVDDVTSRQWGERLIRSWNDSWWDLQLTIGDQLSPIVGAQAGEVIVSDSTSVNIYKLALAALDARPDRSKIVTDDLNFPTDVHILQGIATRTGHRLQIVESDGILGPVKQLEEAIDEDTALVSLSHTVFKSGFTYNLKDITTLAREAGALVLWDCSHSAGVVPIDFTAAGVDLAVGCTYKYLNGGPGSPAWLYVRADLQDQLANPITAWWGHAQPFDFDLDFEAVSGIRRFHTGTMPILSLATIEAGVAIILAAGMDQIRKKSMLLTQYLIGQIETHLASLGFGLVSPRDPEARGSHVSISHQNAWPITQALIDTAGVVPDFRTPDSIRFGLAPLYNTFVEIHTAIQRLCEVIESGSHLRYATATAWVT